MIKTTEDIIYNNLKTSAGFHRSKKFRHWFHEEYPGTEMHHVFGSYTAIRTSDYCSIPVNRAGHVYAERHKSEAAIEFLPKMINVMQKYIMYLEGK